MMPANLICLAHGQRQNDSASFIAMQLLKLQIEL